MDDRGQEAATDPVEAVEAALITMMGPGADVHEAREMAD